jgi:hypothetical protein
VLSSKSRRVAPIPHSVHTREPQPGLNLPGPVFPVRNRFAPRSVKAQNENPFELAALRRLVAEEWRTVRRKAQQLASGPVVSLQPLLGEHEESLPSHPELASLSLAGERWSGTIACDLDNLPVRSESVRMVVARHVFDLLPTQSLLIEELARVLVPGGTILLFGLNPLSPWRLWSLRQARNGLRMPRHHRASHMGRLLKGVNLEIAERRYLGGRWPASPSRPGPDADAGSATQWDAAWMLLAHKPGVATRLVGLPSRKRESGFAGGLVQMPSRRARA